MTLISLLLLTLKSSPQAHGRFGGGATRVFVRAVLKLDVRFSRKRTRSGAAGLLHALLGVPDVAALQGHPKLSASWEGFCLEQLYVVHPG